MKKSQLILWSLVNSLGAFIYIALVSLFMSNTTKIFGQMSDVWGGIIILLLLVFSALVMGVLILGRPIIFYLNGQKKEGVKLLIYTLITLFLLLLITIIIYLLAK
jgi:hypothetical protein